MPEELTRLNFDQLSILLQAVSEKDANINVVPMMIKALDTPTELKNNQAILRILNYCTSKPSFSMRNTNLVDRIATHMIRTENLMFSLSLVQQARFFSKFAQLQAINVTSIVGCKRIIAKLAQSMSGQIDQMQEGTVLTVLDGLAHFAPYIGND